jgi:two-component system NarL family response regulator
VRQIWDAGARGYLHKERALAQVELALASLMVGASWWDQKATAVLQRSGSQQAVAALNQDERLNDLTQREREVLACLAAGDNNRCIAEQLGIGEGTVRSHVHALLQKLQVSNRTQAALIWLTAGEQC